MNPPRQGVLLWEIPPTQELPHATQQLLAAMNTTPTNTEEERNEREDSTESH